MFYSEKEKMEICLDIAKQLKFFENKNGTINLTLYICSQT